MSGSANPEALRQLILQAVPTETAQYGEAPPPGQIYVPAAHARALRPESALVVGIRGTGKSFWAGALQDVKARAAIGGDVLPASVAISPGFGNQPLPDAYPGKAALRSLSERFEPQMIWRTVVLSGCVGPAARPPLGAGSTWQERVSWVEANPEPVDRMLFDLDLAFSGQGRQHLFVFDALDRMADTWPEMNRLVRGLLQSVLDFRPYRSIRLKVFARPDQIEDDMVMGFPDASKVVAQRTELTWPRTDLYGLLWQLLGNAPGGELFRSGVAGGDWTRRGDAWEMPAELRRDEDRQRRTFQTIAGPWMGRDRRRGIPYTWLVNHLGDARQQVSPRSFLTAIRRAAEDDHSGQPYALHYEGLRAGVQAASEVRVAEIREDYSWIGPLLEPLKNLSVPCPANEITRIWKNHGSLDALAEAAATAEGVRLPPAHLGEREGGVLRDLEQLGMVEFIRDGRVNMPDVYRVRFGIGRRGGVKPVR